MATLQSLQVSVMALKEVVEMLTRQRGDVHNSVVTWEDLLSLNSPETGKRLIDPMAVPRMKTK